VANTAQAKKRARQAEAHRVRNAAQRTQLHTAIKKVRLAVAGLDKAKAQAAYRDATAVIDRMADKGIIHKNAAARQKSSLNKKVKELATKAA
jgi:small subunit ribosomal protein S20